MGLNAVKPVKGRKSYIASEIARIYPEGANFSEADAREARANLKQCLPTATGEERAFARQEFGRIAMRAAEDGMAYADMLKAKKYFRGVKAEGPAEEVDAAHEVLFREREAKAGAIQGEKKSVLEFVKTVIPASKAGKWDEKGGQAVMRFADLARALGSSKGFAPLKGLRFMEPLPPVKQWEHLDRVLAELEPKAPAAAFLESRRAG